MASLKMENTPVTPFSSPEPVVCWLQIKPSGSGDENDVTLACVADALNLFIYKWFRRCVGRLQRRLLLRRPDSIQSEKLRYFCTTTTLKYLVSRFTANINTQ